jgi:tRNA (guanine-N7-)-methyltransferase
MGRKNKLQRFADIATYPNVFETDKALSSYHAEDQGVFHPLRGEWATQHFKNQNPIVLELACGKGDYTIALGRLHPEYNFIGVDIKGARIWRGARTALETNLNNVAFLRTRIEFIDRFFAPGEISEIWITFPDPFEGKDSRRLTSPGFLERYRRLLKPDGLVHLKTDSRLLYEYSLNVLYEDPQCEVLYASSDIYSRPLDFPELAHKTYYETMHLAEGRKITYIRCRIFPRFTP